MNRLCRHCATPYTQGTGVDGFCCPGCRQVHALIQDEGLEDYYRMQDRATEPLKNRSLAEPDLLALRGAQAEVEGEAELGQASFKIEGMSCMGCAWLIERLASNQAGLVRAEASLSKSLLTVQWRSQNFDLSVLGTELFKFGYRIRSKPVEFIGNPRCSPLAFCCLLSFVFSGNALLLAGFNQYVAPAEDFETLIRLLSLICLCFTLLLGAAPFFMSAYRAFQIRRWHSDWIPVAMIVVWAVYIAFEIAASALTLSLGVFLISALVCILIGARCLGSRVSS